MLLRRALSIARVFAAVILWHGASGQIISTVAGTNWVFPISSGPAISAPLGLLAAVALDSHGNIYAADNGTNIVVRISPQGQLTVVAGNGILGFSGDGGPATSASLNLPSGVAVDSAGDVYISDYGNNRIRKVSGGIITTVAGNGLAEFEGDGGPATSAALNNPNGVALDSAGNIYIADTLNSRIRKVSGGTITTIAGNGHLNFSGDGGPAISAALYYPAGVAVDAAGDVYIADVANNRVRKVSAGVITTIAGNGNQAFAGDGGAATSASLYYPVGVGLDSQGNLYIAEEGDSRVRKVSGGTITTVAGNGTQGDTGDGGPAISASIYSAEGVVVDSTGNLYIADTFNYRIRKVSGGTISTVAGSGAYQFSGDGGPATSAALNTPIYVAVDSAGNVYIADTFNNRIREVSNGIIDTVAGDGTAGHSGDGGPATSASLANPQGVTVDSAGDLYISDTSNNRVRKVSNGIITTVAGNGSSGFSGDGGPATSASISGPAGLAVDSAGNLYIADFGNNRIRKVSGGTITTFAGSGPLTGGFYGDGGPATSAALYNPSALAIDSSGNLYIADAGNNRIRKVSGGIITTVAGDARQGFSGDGAATGISLYDPTGVAVDSAGDIYISDLGNVRLRKVSGGIITTIAGDGNVGNSGDGGLAANALFGYPTSVAVDAGGNIYVDDANNNRIRVVLGNAPLFTTSIPSGNLSLSASSGGKPATANLTVSTAIATGSPVVVPGMAYTAQVSSGADWLSISPQSGVTPGLLTVTADPSGLAPNTYQATITLSIPHANPAVRTISVVFTVSAAIAPSLSVDHNHLSFTYSSTSTARTQTLTVSNIGGGSLPFTVSVTPNAGQSATWLSVTPTSGIATPATPTVLTVQADPTNFAPGTYSASIVIGSASGSATVSVVMTISTNPLIILLSQTGLTFTAVQNGGAVPTQTFSVLNLGSGALSWTAQTSVLGGVNNWLTASPDNGVSNAAASSTAPVVTVGVNATGLTPGVYYGLVTVTSAGAANTPQGVVAILQVLPAGTDIAPVVQPASLTFTGPAGNSSPGSQNVQVYDPTGTNKSFRSAIATASGESWLVMLPTDATIPSSGPVPVVVQPIVDGLSAGTYQGTLTLQFSDGRVSRVGVQFVVTGGGGAPTNAVSAIRPAQANGPCVSNQLMPSLLTLGSGFTVPAGYPWGLEAQVVDNCGAPQVDGTVFVQFSNGDAPVKLQSLGNGVWDGTWPVGSTPAAVTLTVLAQNAASVKGQSVLDGGLAAAMPSPIIPNNGVVSTASFAAGQPVAPGELISIFGQQLSGGQEPAGAGNLPTVLAGTTVAVGSQTGPSAGIFQALPLYYASTGLVNAVVPFETSVNTNQQILLQWGTAYAPPVYVDVAAAAPGIFAVADLSGNVIGPNNPATAGQTVVIYCAGLGAVSPSVPDGAGSTALSYALNPVTVTIGGQTISNPIFAGLTPGVAGLYQVNIAVPSGIAPGDSVPVSITAAGQPSAQVVTSVR